MRETRGSQREEVLLNPHSLTPAAQKTPTCQAWLCPHQAMTKGEGRELAKVQSKLGEVREMGDKATGLQYSPIQPSTVQSTPGAVRAGGAECD